MKKTKEADERERRLAKITSDYSEAWSLGLCNGLGKAASIAIGHGAARVAEDIIANGLRRFPVKFREELDARKIDLQALGLEP